MHSRIIVFLVFGVLAVVLFGAHARAQCTTPWLPGDGLPGLDGASLATCQWDPDGPGPMQPLLAVGGGFPGNGVGFTIAGTAQARSIATYDPVSGVWSALGTGVNGSVYALTALPNGDLIAGGDFTTAGGVSANRIARWNGTTWSALGTGMNGNVSALRTMPNGDLVAGGAFSTAGGVSVNNIARWDGTTWSAFGTGMSGRVDALVTLSNGDLVAGGAFTTAGGVAASRIARWDGTGWSAMGSGMTGMTLIAPTRVFALTTLPNGDLVAGGSFSQAGGVPAASIARWNGTSWSAGYAGLNGRVFALTTLPSGDLVAGGEFIGAAARWNGTAWSGLGFSGNDSVWTLATLSNGDLVAGGFFSEAGGVAASFIARWSGTSWSALSTGMNGAVAALTKLPNGDLVAGGAFTTTGGVAAKRIARWNGTSWFALGTGMGASAFSSGSVFALAQMSNGDFVAGGDFDSAGGVPASCVARWNGTAWSALGSGMGFIPPTSIASVYAMTTLPNGDLVAGGFFAVADALPANNIARWNGTSWSALGTGMNDIVRALIALPNGDLVAAGDFTTAGGVAASRIARWNGTSWSALGSGMSGRVSALATLPNGDLVAGGGFGTAGGLTVNRIARWDGSAWSALGSGLNSTVNALAVLPNGDVVAGGSFTTAGGLAASRIARWNGAAWSALGAGMDGVSPVSVTALATLSNGDLMVGGGFFTAGGFTSAYLARLTTTCPATAISTGAACPGSGGANSYEAQTLPWVGSTFRARSTTIPSFAFVLIATGFSTTSVPLDSLLPLSPPACNLLVNPDLLEWTVSNAGTLDTAQQIPNTIGLAGLTLHQQLILLEVDQSLAFLENTSSNAISVTLGIF